jgi:hypothetical protein
MESENQREKENMGVNEEFIYKDESEDKEIQEHEMINASNEISGDIRDERREEEINVQEEIMEKELEQEIEGQSEGMELEVKIENEILLFEKLISNLEQKDEEVHASLRSVRTNEVSQGKKRDESFIDPDLPLKEIFDMED